MTVAALYVDPNGVYAGLPDVEIWDEQRDARLYRGPHRVVAHPPCTRWCRLAKQVEWRGIANVGDDGGTFAAALESVRAYGGVLEHPAHSLAWPAHGLNKPAVANGWVNADFEGGWTCYVEQWRYGHVTRKATWLYAFGVELPSLEWGYIADQDCDFNVAWNHQNQKGRKRMPDSWRSRTPEAFRDVLLEMVR